MAAEDVTMADNVFAHVAVLEERFYREMLEQKATMRAGGGGLTRSGTPSGGGSRSVWRARRRSSTSRTGATT